MDTFWWPVVRCVPQGAVVHHSHAGEFLYCSACSSDTSKRQERMRDRSPQSSLGSKGKPSTGSCHYTKHSEGASNKYIPYGWCIDCFQCGLWKPDDTLGFAHSSLNVKHKTTVLLWNTTKRWREEWLAFTGLFSNCKWFHSTSIYKQKKCACFCYKQSTES